MSRKPSKRDRQIEAIIDLMRNPAFTAYHVPNGPVDQYRVTENPRRPDLASYSPDVMPSYFSERFDDKGTAVFCRDWKNAEAILAAIEKESGN